MQSDVEDEIRRLSYLDRAKLKGAEAFIVTGPGQDKEGFDIHEVSQHFPNTVEEVISILSKEDERGRPKLTPRAGLDDYTYSEPYPAFVSVDKVVGGWNYAQQPDGHTTWLVDSPGNEREHRGAPRILEIVDKFREGELFLPSAPIRVEKHGDDYYIGGDGRHRVAAMKAMGVKEIPMIVTEATKN